MLSTLHSHNHYRKACFDSWPYSFCKNSRDNEIHGAADLDDRPKFFSLPSFSIYSIDLTEDGKLGYGFTSADELGCILPQQKDAGRRDKVSRYQEAMPLFILYVHQASSHLTIG
jgi:hypothetical protein